MRSLQGWLSEYKSSFINALHSRVSAPESWIFIFSVCARVFCVNKLVIVCKFLLIALLINAFCELFVYENHNFVWTEKVTQLFLKCNFLKLIWQKQKNCTEYLVSHILAKLIENVLAPQTCPNPINRQLFYILCI